MNTTYRNRGSAIRYPRRNHFLAALFAAAIVMTLTVPALAVVSTANTSEPDTENSVSTPVVVDTSTDNSDALSETDEADDSESMPMSPSGPVSTADELLYAIAHANANDVIEIDNRIVIPYDVLVLGRDDCPVTIRRTTYAACLELGEPDVGSVKVQNITFDGAEILAGSRIVSTMSLTQTFENCSFINCFGDRVCALSVSGAGETIISNCHFANNRGSVGAHLWVTSRRATIENCTFTGGYASYKGSLYMCPREEVHLIGCTVTGNAAGTQGGGIYLDNGSSLSIAKSKIYGNTVSGAANDIVKTYASFLSLVDDYAALVELYKPDGVIPNMWTVEGCFITGSDVEPYRVGMVFSMTFADNEPSLDPKPDAEHNPDPEPELTSITLDKSELTLDVGETESLTVALYPEGTSGSVQWTSSDLSVASVSENGLITAHSAGTALITATVADNELSASCRVTVQNVPDVTTVPDVPDVTTVPDAPATTTYSIAISSSPIDGGVVSGNGQYKEGAVATVTGVPNEGFRFLTWTEADAQISTEASLTFSVSNDRELTAIFEPIPKSAHAINVTAAVGGTASGGGEYEAGSSVTLTATPESNYLFTGWTEDDEQVSADESFTFIADRDRTLVANFEPIPKTTYTIQVSSTQGGTVDGGGTYEDGKDVVVNAVPDSGYRFLRWEENGVQVSTDARYSFTAESSRTLVAVFGLVPQATADVRSNAQPVATSMPARKEVQIPKLTNGKAVLIAPDDSFWEGYKAGRGNGTATVTRADLAQLLYSMMDSESKKIYEGTQSPFNDVKSGALYESAVGAMFDTRIMVGCGNNLFCPDHTLTWGELLTAFARFAEDKPLAEYYTGEHWAKDSVNKAFSLDWLEYTEGFEPGGIVTTGEMVNLIQAVFRWSNE